MTTKYLLPCSCGKSVAVAASQAGEKLQCTCGLQLEVPSMSAIRQLQTVADAPTKRDQSHWSLLRGMLFAVGLVCLCCGIGAGIYYQWGRMQLDTSEKPWDDMANDLSQIDNLSPLEVWEILETTQKDGIGPQRPPDFVVSRRVSNILLQLIWGGIVLASIGLVMIFTALLLPGRRDGRPRRRTA